MEPKGSLPLSQEPATCPYPDPNEYNPHLTLTKMAIFWVVAPCSLVEVYQRFRGPWWFHHQGEHGPLKRC
jgi:hypothetical protein